MRVNRFIFNDFGENTLVVWDPDTLEAAVIDPGCSVRRETEALDNFIEKNHLKVTHLVNTHIHIDHVMGNGHISGKYGVECEANPADAFLGARCREQAQRFGLRGDYGSVEIGKELHDGDKIRIGSGELEVLAVPGHSPGSIALYSPADGFVITGDALFRQSIGRTDLPGGDYATLVDAIRSKLFALPDATVVIPGHGPETTIGTEKRTNPYLI